MKRPLAYITAPWSENEFEKHTYFLRRTACAL